MPSRGILRALGFFIFHAAALAHVPCFSGLLVCPQLYGFGAGEALAALVLLPNVHVRSRKACNSVRSWSLRSCLGKVWKHFYNLRLRLTWGPVPLQLTCGHGAGCMGICQAGEASGTVAGKGELLSQPLALPWVWLSHLQCPRPLDKPPRCALGVPMVFMAGTSRRQLAAPLS